VETSTGYFLNVLVYWFVVLLHTHHKALRKTINYIHGHFFFFKNLCL